MPSSASLLIATAAWSAAALSAAAAAGPPSCSVRSQASRTPVVELYTSEGCNSCPPADRWLSRLTTSSPDAVALAFHVDYWDRLGWKDRFASPAYTQRQQQTHASSGARFSYTPQVIVDGKDRPDWSRVALPSPAPADRADANVDITLARDGERYFATVTPRRGAPARLAAYWAWTEDGHSSAVQAGENEGVTLHHDRVVRDYRGVAPWRADGGATTLRYESAPPRDAAHPAALNLVVVDADSGRPVQALRLGC
ncbi:MAG TPA: DUF1223 domain-containing protein [Burkholderiaceae bacterium]